MFWWSRDGVEDGISGYGSAGAGWTSLIGRNSDSYEGFQEFRLLVSSKSLRMRSYLHFVWFWLTCFWVS